MAVELYRCSNMWAKVGAHPCWKVQKALDEMGVEYTIVKGPLRRAKRDVLAEGTGQRLYPAIKFEDGSWYKEESSDMERTIRAGKLRERDTQATAPTSG
jgi:hypothetical protein